PSRAPTVTRSTWSDYCCLFLNNAYDTPICQIPRGESPLSTMAHRNHVSGPSHRLAASPRPGNPVMARHSRCVLVISRPLRKLVARKYHRETHDCRKLNVSRRSTAHLVRPAPSPRILPCDWTPIHTRRRQDPSRRRLATGLHAL